MTGRRTAHPGSRATSRERDASDAVRRGRQLFGARSWGESYAALRDADAAAPLEGEDLELYAMAAYLVGQPAASVDLWNRAHGQYLSAGQVTRAARCAIRIGIDLLNAGERVRGAGWVDKARRLLDEQSTDCVERGYLLLPEGVRLITGGDPVGAEAAFERAAAFGQRFGDRDLVVMARHGVGRALIRRGRLREGCALLDQAMIALEAGEVSPVFAGDIYCSVIEASLEIFDVRRAREWTTALAHWCESQPDLVPYTGQCLVRRAEIMVMNGEWAAAVEVARRACEHFVRGPEQRASASAFYQCGELHRLQGNFAEAETCYREATRRGRQPQPGLALLRLAQGQGDAAAASIRATLEQSRTPAARGRVLPAYVEIMLAVNDLIAARAGAEELAQLAGSLDAPLLRAAADQAAGAVALAAGDARAALDALRAAWAEFQELEAPYEAARARVLIGVACRAMGDHDAARLEMDAARWQFEQLSAAPDVARLDSLAPAKQPKGILTDRELQVLRLVAAGDTNRAVAAKLRIAEKTVARHVANIFLKLGVSTRAAATAYAYEHGLTAQRG